MADERKGGHRRHNVTMEQRERIVISGVMDVLSFDEEEVVADTDMGILIIRGESLHVSRLNLENGDLHVEGGISMLMYEEEGFTKAKGVSFLGKLFR